MHGVGGPSTGGGGGKGDDLMQVIGKVFFLNALCIQGLLTTVNDISVCKYWKILFYPPNTGTET